MPHLPRIDGPANDDGMRTYVLLPLSRIQHRTQSTVLPLSSVAARLTPPAFPSCLDPYQQVQISLFSFLLPRSKEVIKYLCRTSDCSEWKKRRYINNIRQGLIVDFHDNFNMWRRAVVMKTFFNDSDKMMVVLKMHVKGT